MLKAISIVHSVACSWISFYCRRVSGKNAGLWSCIPESQSCRNWRRSSRRQIQWQPSQICYWANVPTEDRPNPHGIHEAQWLDTARYIVDTWKKSSTMAKQIHMWRTETGLNPPQRQFVHEEIDAGTPCGQPRHLRIFCNMRMVQPICDSSSAPTYHTVRIDPLWQYIFLIMWSKEDIEGFFGKLPLSNSQVYKRTQGQNMVVRIGTF